MLALASLDGLWKLTVMNSNSAGFLADRFLSRNNPPKSGKPPVRDWSNLEQPHKKVVQLGGIDERILGASKGLTRRAYKINIAQLRVDPELKGAPLKTGVLHEISGDFAEKFVHKFLKVIEDRSPACSDTTDGFWLATPAVRRERVGAWVSSETSDYVAGELADAQPNGDDSRALAAKKIEYSMSTLINSIAEGVRDKGQSTKFDLASNERFLDGVARAILFRLPVSFYKESGFIASLYRDFELAVSAGKVAHDWWDVSMSSPGLITLTIKNETPLAVAGEKPWKKARAIRFSSLKRE